MCLKKTLDEFSLFFASFFDAQSASMATPVKKLIYTRGSQLCWQHLGSLDPREPALLATPKVVRP